MGLVASVHLENFLSYLITVLNRLFDSPRALNRVFKITTYVRSLYCIVIRVIRFRSSVRELV